MVFCRWNYLYEKIFDFNMLFIFLVVFGMDNRSIEYLIEKYDKPYVSGERHSSMTDVLLKRNQRMFEKHSICDDLIGECCFHFNSSQRDFVHYLIDCLGSDFKKLHGRASKESIILAFIFYVKKIEDSRVSIDNYSICKRYGLTDDVFILVVCRICDYFVKSAPVKNYASTRYDHDILSKNGGKL